MIFISTYDGTPCELKGSRTVWSGGKPGDSIKGLPIAIRGLDILQRQRRDVCDRPRRRGRRPATYCAPISWEEATPSDLVFYPEDSHVGIVGGWDEDGNLLVIHCSSNSNNVVISGADGFAEAARPVYYELQSNTGTRKWIFFPSFPSA